MSAPTKSTLRFCTFYKAPTNFLSGIRALFKPGPLQYVVHLERLHGLRISRFHYVPMTDELAVEAEYEGHHFSIEMSWGGDLDLTASVEVPEELFRRVCTHLHAYRWISPFRMLSARERYARIAKSAG